MNILLIRVLLSKENKTIYKGTNRQGRNNWHFRGKYYFRPKTIDDFPVILNSETGKAHTFAMLLAYAARKENKVLNRKGVD